MRSNARAGELLDQVRQYYVDRFIKARDELLAEQNTRLIVEPELRGSDGAIVTEGALKLPLRTDMVVINEGGAKTLSIDTERTVSFEPISFIWGRAPQGAAQPISVARNAELVKALSLNLPGSGFYLVHLIMRGGKPSMHSRIGYSLAAEHSASLKT